LLVLFFNRRRHQYLLLVGVIGARLVVELYLLVSGALDGNAELQVAGDGGVVLALWVGEGQPLVVEGVVVLEVDQRDVDVEAA